LGSVRIYTASQGAGYGQQVELLYYQFAQRRWSAATRYRPRKGLFMRIDHHRDATNDYWEVRSKDGLVSLYGTPGAAGHDPAVVAKPEDRTRVFAWELSRTTDPFGNRIEYEYAREAKTSSPVTFQGTMEK
jgi:hypothetical protein